MVPTLSEFHADLLEQLSRTHPAHAGARSCPTATTRIRARSCEGLDFFASHRVDALVMDGSAIAARAIAAVRRCTASPSSSTTTTWRGLPADRVFVENRKASRRAVDHLIDLGHERIATITGNLHNSAGARTLAGYHDALAAHGMPVEPRLVIDGHWREDRWLCRHARRSSALRAPPTAVFSANYNMTIGALTWMREHGLRTAGRPLAGQLRRCAGVPRARAGHHRRRPAGRQDRRQRSPAMLATRLAKPGAMGRTRP